jgi:hypothetical protein
VATPAALNANIVSANLRIVISFLRAKRCLALGETTRHRVQEFALR